MLGHLLSHEQVTESVLCGRLGYSERCGSHGGGAPYGRCVSLGGRGNYCRMLLLTRTGYWFGREGGHRCRYWHGIRVVLQHALLIRPSETHGSLQVGQVL